MGGFGIPGMAQRKNAPKPKQPLKSFNWSKLEDVSNILHFSGYKKGFPSQFSCSLPL